MVLFKIKNLHENKSLNQINLFNETVEESNDELLIKQMTLSLKKDCQKEFETLGFFISDHPLNHYKDIFPQYNIINFDEFNLDEALKDGVIATTVLKIQEKKNQKGLSYAIIKFTDLGGVFELFIFSDLFEQKREILKRRSICFFESYEKCIPR